MTEHVHNRRQKYMTNSLFNIGARAINRWTCVYVYVCMYMCVCACVYICVYMCVYVCVCVCVYI